MQNTFNMKRFAPFGLMLLMLCAITMILPAGSAFAQGRDHRQYREFVDSRHNHNHSYPVRGQYIGQLPGGNRAVMYRNSRYYYAHGAWYRPEGRRFFVVAPPIGVFVPFLPAFYATLWVHDIPYYYANEIYYTPTAGGYVVAEPPQSDVSSMPPANDQATESRLFIYPRQGQNEKQQANDRYECHSWAVDQTNYDPIKPPSGIPADQLLQQRGDYQRAMGACLEGRGYTVK